MSDSQSKKSQLFFEFIDKLTARLSQYLAVSTAAFILYKFVSGCQEVIGNPFQGSDRSLHLMIWAACIVLAILSILQLLAVVDMLVNALLKLRAREVSFLSKLFAFIAVALFAVGLIWAMQISVFLLILEYIFSDEAHKLTCLLNG